MIAPLKPSVNVCARAIYHSAYTHTSHFAKVKN